MSELPLHLNSQIALNKHATQKVRPHLKKALEARDAQAVIDCLTDKQKSFVEEYLKDLNGTQAVIRSGYNTKNPNRLSSELLRNPGIRFAIDALKAKRAKDSDVTSDYVLKEVVTIIEKCKENENYNPNAALRGLELLARHLGMLVDKTELTGKGGEAIQYQKVEEDADEFTRTISSLADRARTHGILKVVK